MRDLDLSTAIPSLRAIFDPLGYRSVGVIGGNGTKYIEDHARNATKPNVGPLPHGLYTLGEEFTHTHAGPISMRLESDPTNEMFLGRAGFLLHGDNATHTASEGCIVMPHDIRVKMAASEDRRLEVVA